MPKGKNQNKKGKGLKEGFQKLGDLAWYGTLQALTLGKADNVQLGEHHSISVGKPTLNHISPFYSDAYQGPHTNIYEKTVRNVRPINEIDKISQKHDIDAILNPRNADSIMLKNIINKTKTPLDVINNASGFLGIAAKKYIVDPIFGQNSITQYGTKGFNDQQLATLKNKQYELQKQGYGKRKKKK